MCYLFQICHDSARENESFRNECVFTFIYISSLEKSVWYLNYRYNVIIKSLKQTVSCVYIDVTFRTISQALASLQNALLSRLVLSVRKGSFKRSDSKNNSFTNRTAPVYYSALWHCSWEYCTRGEHQLTKRYWTQIYAVMPCRYISISLVSRFANNSFYFKATLAY